jgi:hypothetical protein
MIILVSFRKLRGPNQRLVFNDKLLSGLLIRIKDIWFLGSLLFRFSYFVKTAHVYKPSITKIVQILHKGVCDLMFA